ncbi:hypothetical protein [Chryseobacterium sp. JAH]|uniref:hypothetical protein n=1 Tax=Chryseobacterium sp. JAH TaxID=1742858 RepID=UPI000740F44A|nr:hypothetical protein [Chryseobacterium sp. JAH]KUJ52816.1 hypothetical protein AR685_00030 [Chryseobacterium sp. JAH]
MKKYNYLIMLFFLFSQYLFSQQTKDRTFREIRKTYEKKTTDDSSAMPAVQLYIQKAKTECDFKQLIQGYRDGRQFTSSFHEKMKYADSTLQLSVVYGTRDDISKDYLSKGILYYFYKKKYKLALDQYLKAFTYAKDTKDEFHHYKVIYHLGIVKSHLGYYDEAIQHFQKCISYYEATMSQKIHDNEYFNNKKAYLNSLHQMTVIRRYQKDFSKSDSISRLGYDITVNDAEFSLENSYFLKCIGISKYQKKQLASSKSNLQQALPVILKRNDFAWATVIYYYLGKIHAEENDQRKALIYFKKIDSVFVKQNFILPEVMNNYEYLIRYYHNNNLKKELYYTNQLLKADHLITKDFSYLSSKIHKDYDRTFLLEERQDLERRSIIKSWFSHSLLCFLVILGFLYILRYRREKVIKKQYELLKKKLGDTNSSNLITPTFSDSSVKHQTRKKSLSAEINEGLGKKIEKFEKECGFRKLGLTQKILADSLGTNSDYLSIYINENKGMSFPNYIAELRINYITNLMNTDKKYLSYNIDVLANTCGISTRQKFSELFYKINGIRPIDFINKRKQELDIS